MPSAESVTLWTAAFAGLRRTRIGVAPLAYPSSTGDSNTISGAGDLAEHGRPAAGGQRGDKSDGERQPCRHRRPPSFEAVTGTSGPAVVTDAR